MFFIIKDKSTRSHHHHDVQHRRLEKYILPSTPFIDLYGGAHWLEIPSHYFKLVFKLFISLISIFLDSFFFTTKPHSSPSTMYHFFWYRVLHRWNLLFLSPTVSPSKRRLFALGVFWSINHTHTHSLAATRPISDSCALLTTKYLTKHSDFGSCRQAAWSLAGVMWLFSVNSWDCWVWIWACGATLTVSHLGVPLSCPISWTSFSDCHFIRRSRVTFVTVSRFP